MHVHMHTRTHAHTCQPHGTACMCLPGARAALSLRPPTAAAAAGVAGHLRRRHQLSAGACVSAYERVVHTFVCSCVCKRVRGCACLHVCTQTAQSRMHMQATAAPHTRKRACMCTRLNPSAYNAHKAHPLFSLHMSTHHARTQPLCALCTCRRGPQACGTCLRCPRVARCRAACRTPWQAWPQGCGTCGCAPRRPPSTPAASASMRACWRGCARWSVPVPLAACVRARLCTHAALINRSTHLARSTLPKPATLVLLRMCVGCGPLAHLLCCSAEWSLT